MTNVLAGYAQERNIDRAYHLAMVALYGYDPYFWLSRLPLTPLCNGSNISVGASPKDPDLDRRKTMEQNDDKFTPIIHNMDATIAAEITEAEQLRQERNHTDDATISEINAERFAGEEIVNDPPSTEQLKAEAHEAELANLDADPRNQDPEWVQMMADKKTENERVKTQAEVIDLINQWEADGCWDIEKTEGFEMHHDALLAYRLAREKEWQREEMDRLLDKANILGCTVAMVRYLEIQEQKIDRLDRANDKRRGE